MHKCRHVSKEPRENTVDSVARPCAMVASQAQLTLHYTTRQNHYKSDNVNLKSDNVNFKCDNDSGNVSTAYSHVSQQCFCKSKSCSLPTINATNGD